MREQLFYPAVFELGEGGEYTITFPDLEGCITQGKDLEEGYKMAFEVLGMTLTYFEEEKREIPEPSNPKDIKLSEDEFVAIIEFDLMDYRRRYDSKAVSKNCTIPNWMNTIALERGLNFSQVLQEALMERLGLRSKIQ